ncbi:alpha-amylase family glycosyl hydrolase [Bifidobacterium pseudocatenulatum]|uniref:alpha-amylase family glycosyl hydrolase n=1 Tax=Bifidobacterium pseudocatenulatum TaxID=28026 RepID=UPI0032F046D3
MKHRKPTPAWQKLGLRVSKKLAVGATALATVFGGLAVASVSAQASTDRNSYADTVGNPTFEAARKKYGLTKEMKNGAILHAWMWSFNTITEHMDEIAEAGYTSIQTEPMSKIKVNDANGKKFTENWYYVYQPTNTSIGNFVVGSEDDLKAMTVAAHAHGIRIIVDVVANHFTADWNAIDSDWQKSEYFHARNSCSGSGGDNIDYSNRWQVTHCHLLGLWDLNTANPEVANRMHDFLKTAVNDGVDGFRFDAGKHVELPNEFDGSQYWTTILQNGSQYQYGEVLQGDSGLDYKAYANLYAKYGEGGGGATASDYGKTIRSALWSKNLNAGNLMSLRNGGVNDDQLVTWVESHDNYANSDKESTYLTNDQIRFGWAVVGARAGGAPLFFNRPKASGGNQPQFAEASQLGDAGDDMWKDTAVAAVNHFHNAMDGEAEYLRNCGSEQNNNSCLMVERYKTDNNAGNDGVSIANMGGDQNLAGTPTKLDDGTYTDQVNGGTITVSNGKITSGTAKGDAVSVYFNTSVKESVSATVSKKFSSNTIKVTLNASNATNLTYSLSNGKNGSFVDGDSLTIGGDMEIGDSVTLTVKGTGAESGEALEFTATYTKVEVQANTIYATKPSGWSKMYAYVYTGDGATAKNNAAWPGVEMTAMAAADSCAKAGTYKYEVPDLGEGTYRVIFSNGSGSQMPGASQPGFEFSGKVSWDGSSASLTAITCTATPPVIKTADITFSATADLKTGETLYAVGDWGQGKGKTWTRAGGVKLARYGNAYTGTTKVGKGNAITFRLIKVDANGKTTWDSAKDRKSKADKTKALGVSWTSGKVNEDGTIPDDSAISISGKGVADGKLSIQKGNLAELYVIGTQDATPSDAVWWSDGAAVAVSGTGTVYGVQTGTAKVNVKVGNQTATITITIK